jgi:uncharacterized protein (TIGR02265 family)
MTSMPQEEPMVAGGVLEGLVHALRPEGAFAEELCAVGFDAARQAARYPQKVLVRSLDVARKHRFPTLPRQEAWRQLGKLFIEGYFQTAPGRLIGFSVPALRPTRFVSMIPIYVRTGLLGTRTEVKLLGPQSAQVIMTGGHPGCAWLFAGVLEVCFQRMSVPCRFEPAWEEPCAQLTLVWGTAV